MNAYTKVFLVGFVSMLASVAITFVMIIITAGVTSKWSSGELGPVLGGLLVGAFLVFGIGTVVVNRVAASAFDRPGPVWLLTLLYFGLVLAVVLILGFTTLVLFNR